MSKKSETPSSPDTGDTSWVTEDHRALKNQSSVRATQYPQSQRAAQSLVNKDKSAAGAVVNPGPKKETSQED